MYNVETLAAGTQHITQSQTKTVLNALVITKWPPHPWRDHKFMKESNFRDQ